MAIIIPSKNIYSVENTKIPENKIDKVEFSLQKPYLVNEVKEAFSTDFTEDLQPNTEGLSDYASIVSTERGSGNYEYAYAIAFAGLDQNYFLTDVVIPAKIKNGRIKKALSGVDKDNIANISYNVSYKKRIGWLKVVVKRNADYESYSFQSLEKEEKPYDPETIGYYPTFNENGDLFVRAEYKETSSIPDTVAVAEITRTDQSNNATAVIEYDGSIDSFVVKGLKILSRVETQDAGLATRGTKQEYETLNGWYYEYVATRISVSVKGEVIELQFDDEAKSYARANPQNPFEIEGSQVFQTTNYYLSDGKSVSSSYFNGFNLTANYMNGKETAVIRCSIGDYYDNNGKRVISTQKSKNLLPFDYKIETFPEDLTFSPQKNGLINVRGKSKEAVQYILTTQNPFLPNKTYSISLGREGKGDCSIVVSAKGTIWGQTIYYTFKEGTPFNWEDYLQLIAITIDVDAGQDLDAILSPLVCEGDKPIPFEAPNPPMSFSIYDEVIPMKRNELGEDVPMSIGLSGGIKRFKVLGKRVYFDGATWQELYLQES